MTPALVLYAVYERPAESPGYIVVRRWLPGPGFVLVDARGRHVFSTIGRARTWLSDRGFARGERLDCAESCIVELWREQPGS